MSDGGGKKKLIILALLALVVLGGGGFAYKTLVLDKKKAEAAKLADEKKKQEGEGKEGEGHGAKEDEEEEEEPKAEGGGHGEGGGGAPPVLVYKKVVELKAPRKNTYLKLEFHLLFRDPELGRAVTSDKPTPENSKLQAMVLKMISNKTLEDVQDPEAQEALRLEIKDALNEEFKPKPPKDGEKVDPKHKKPKKPVKDVLVIDWVISQG